MESDPAKAIDAPLDPTPFDAFRELAEKLVQIPKEEVDKKESEYKREQAKKPKRGPKSK